MKKIIVVLLGLFVLLNLFTPEPDCSYSNYTGSFTFAEMNFKERNFRNCEAKFGIFKRQYRTDTVLYRLRSKDLWQFWNYRRYLCSDKYRLPYIEWSDVQLRRGVTSNKTGFQDF